MIFDTSAWIEFFQGTQQGKKVGEVLSRGENFTSIVSIAELINWCLRSNKADRIDEYVNGIKKGSEILELNEDIVKIAGFISYQRKKIISKWGMMDSFILATAQIYNLKILTKDRQFSGLPNIELL